MKKAALLGLFALAVTSCTPGAVEGMARSATSVPVTCSGTSYGTITSAPAQLNVTMGLSGSTGTFTNNGTVFQATGSMITSGNMTTVNLSLSGRTSGSLYGTIDTSGRFEGTFRGIQGNYRTVMNCRAY